MTTKHEVFFQNSNCMSPISDNSVDLVITSPPYPMIEMWDEIMSCQNPEIHDVLTTNPTTAFELMHIELDKVWKECFRVLKDGAFLCINIGDATRSINGEFRLYNNHSRIVRSCEEIGFTNLPNIIWRKTTNAPNKFMGSGMLPCGAYTTLEHEWILIFRKGDKRSYKKDDEKQLRRESAFFWEERNVWFSDLWEIKGAKQQITNTRSRERNASFPLSLPYRIINMYSQHGDTVVDPFYGLGTTMLAAMIAERNSIGFEIDKNLYANIRENVSKSDINKMNAMILQRVNDHKTFVTNRIEGGKELGYYNTYLNCPVMTKQETELTFHYLTDILESSNEDQLLYHCLYEEESDLSQMPVLSGQGLLF